MELVAAELPAAWFLEHAWLIPVIPGVAFALIILIGKRLPMGNVNAESIGLLAFRDGGAEQFSEAIERAIRTAEGTTIWYLRVIHHIAQQADVWTFDIEGEEWGEVDFPPDVDAARELTARWDADQKSAAA